MYRTEHRQSLFGREHTFTDDNITLIGFVAYLAQACGQSGCVNGCINKTQHINRDKDFDFDKKTTASFLGYLLKFKQILFTAYKN